MVEANSVDQTMAFFDAVFEAVPPAYRQVDREDLDGAKKKPKGKQPKNLGKTNGKNVSLLELNELAHERVEGIRRANALKSVNKIKELTIEHEKLKKEGKTPAPVKDEDVIMASGDEAAEESK